MVDDVGTSKYSVNYGGIKVTLAVDRHPSLNWTCTVCSGLTSAMAWVCLNGAEMVVTLETGRDNHLA